MRLLCFNPDNDLALASGDAGYTPPASARQLASDLRQLPLWWASEGDVVLGIPGWDASQVTSVLPWGWSPRLVRQLQGAGVPEGLLPTAGQLAAYRACSSRQKAVELLSRLRASWPEAFDTASGWLAGESVWCRTESEVAAALSGYGRSMLKAPWSGSGRGVHPADAAPGEKTWAWIRRTLARQGGVEAEPFYADKVMDLAMEFWADRGSVRYEGLSLFETTAGGVYAGNLVASEAVKQQTVAAAMGPERLSVLCRRMVRLLSDDALPEWYTGPVGVDMMVVGCGTSARLHPLVEMNLRMTMGWVALQLTSRLAPSHVGRFGIRQAGGHYEAYFLQKPSEGGL